MTTPLAQKREEYRKYLERCGLLDALTKALVSLYDEQEKPEDGLEYLRTSLGDPRPPMSEIERMKCELEESKRKIKELVEEVRILRGEDPLEDDAMSPEKEE